MKIGLEEIMQTFLAECDEDLGKMEQALLLLETSPDDAELVKVLFRVAHTLKGNAGALGFRATAEFAHAAEDLLERVRNKTVPVTGELVTVLLKALDALRALVRGAAAGTDELTVQHRELMRAFSGWPAEAPAQKPPEPNSFEHAPRPPSELIAPQSSDADLATRRPTLALDSRNRTLRVDLERLNELLNLAGEIAIARGRVTDLLEQHSSERAKQILEAHRDADRLHTMLQELVMKLRLVPIGTLFRNFSRAVRDLAAANGKQVGFATAGDDVEVDAAVLEQLRDPLTHMIRNAIDHGIEKPDLRKMQGKPGEGQILLRAFHEGGSVIVEVVDDGAGLRRAQILERARERGISLDPDISEREIFDLVFEPGFSTARSVTELSGRGVGMDVVRRNVESIRGNVSIASQEGRGTTITVRLPLTLSIIQGLRIGVANETYIVPVDSVVECIELPREHARRRGTGFVNLRGNPLPYVRLRDVFRLEGALSQRENLLVVRGPNGRAGLVVDALHGESQTVIKSLGKMFDRVRGFSGSAILGSGQVALILDVTTLLRDAIARDVGAEVT